MSLVSARSIAPSAFGIGLLTASCGPATSAIGGTIGGEEVYGVVVDGTHVAVLERPSEDAVHLSLWVDAGSRDVDPPQAATLAAWIAAPDGIEVEVVPDGTVFRSTCRVRDLGRCARRLAAILGTREVDPSRLADARAELADARRVASADEHRRAEEAALEALLGDDARGFFPLGRAEDDPRCTDRALRAFFEQHYGPSRALVVGVGQIGEDDLASLVEDALEDLPQALGSRPRRDLAFQERRAVVRTGEENVASIAIAAPDISRAARLAFALDEAVDGITTRTFVVRGGALVLATRPVRGDVGFAAAELFAVATSSDPREVPIGFDHPAHAGSSVGMSWLALGGTTAGDELHTALGVVWRPAERGGAPRGDPSESERVRLERALNERVRALAAPFDDGSEARATLENGARVNAVRRERSGLAAIAVRFDVGAAHDPPSFHGRIALVAHALARTCSARFERPIAAGIGAESFTLTARTRSERLTPSIAHLFRCLATPLSDRDVDDARIALLDRSEPGRAWSARQLAPGAPGLISAVGPVEIVRTIPAEAVRRTQHALVSGGHLAIGISGDVAPARAVRLASLWLEPLEDGAPSAVADIGEPLETFEVADWTRDLPRVAIGFRAASNGAGRAAGADLFARLLGGVLANESGLRVVDATGGALPNGAYAVVVCDAGEQALAVLPERIQRALEALSHRTIEARVEAERLEGSLDAAGLEAHAIRLAGGAAPSDDARSAQLAFRSLLTAEPHITVARVQPR